MGLKYRRRFGKTQALVRGRWRVWGRYLKRKARYKMKVQQQIIEIAEETGVLLPDVKKRMLDAFRVWGGSRKTITRNVVNALEDADLNMESDGSFQLGTYEVQGKSGMNVPLFKLTMDVNQRKLTITIRGDYTYVQGV